MHFRNIVTTTALAMLAGLLACAPRAVVDPPPGAVAVADLPDDAVPIQVEHNAPVATSLTIYLVDSVGTRHLLGVVAPAQTETFVIQDPAGPGPYRLIAEGAPGRGLASRPIHLAIRDGVRWILSTNTIMSLIVDEP
jgi:hypothetical protein